MLLPALLFGVSFGLIIYFLAVRFVPGGKRQEQLDRQTRMNTPDLTHLPTSKSILKNEKKTSEIEFFHQFLTDRGIASRLSVMLKTSKINISVSVFLLICFVIPMVSFLIFHLATGTYGGPALAALVLGFLPFLYICIRRKRYLDKFAEFLPDALSTLSRSIKSGRSLEGSIDVVAQTSPKPISEEFEALRAEIKLGVPIEQALNNLQKRIDNPSLKILATGIAIHYELGGNLSEILDNLERTIRERFSITREIHTLSSQGRYSAWLLFALPFALLAFYASNNSDIFWKFANSNFGSGMIWMTIMVDGAALLWMRQLVRLND